MLTGEKSAELAAFREQLDRILASRDFQTSRHLSEFLRFTSERAFEGCVHLEQNEIAAHVLKNEDFVPAYDSSVRKLASMTRQRLAKYYEHEGAGDPVWVVLPLRSYLPAYSYKSRLLTVDPPVYRNQSNRRSWRRIAAATAILCASAAVWSVWPRHSLSEGIVYRIETRAGDMAGRSVDAASENLLLGPPMEDSSELTALLSFRPEYEAQQAGIVIWQDGDNFIRVGRRFVGRNYLEFGAEVNARSVPSEGNLPFDPEGQSGRPVWLSIRRNGDAYGAFTSFDGTEWKPAGAPLTLPSGALRKARIGIYAFNGRREAPSAVAEFRQVSLGHTFPNASETNWSEKLSSNCPADAILDGVRPSLLIRLHSRKPSCMVTLDTWRYGAEDWTIDAKIDFVGAPGVMAGLYVRGSGARARLLRTDMNGPAVELMHDGKGVYVHKDFNGSPPLFLRLQRKGPSLIGGFSRDGQNFETIKRALPVNELGASLQTGLLLSTAERSEPAIEPSMRAYYIRRHAPELKPYR